MAGTLTVSQATCHIPELWNSRTRDGVEANVVAAGLVDQSYTKQLVGGPGDVMNIPYISNPTAETKTANTNIVLQVIGPSSAEASQSFSVGTQQHVAWGVETITDLQSQTDLASKYGGKAGYVLGAAADTNLHTLPQSFSQTVGTLGVEPTDDNWLRASQYLDDANAPDGDRFIIVRPATYYSLLKSDKYTRTDYVGPASAGKAVKNAMIGRLYNAPIYKTTLVRAAAAGQADNWFCHKSGVYYCSQKTYAKVAYSINQDSEVSLHSHVYGYAEALQPPITAGGGAATDVFNCVVFGTS